MAEIRMVQLSKILPNPYRKMDRYPLKPEKIEELIQSYETSGFWDGSIQGRNSAEQRGKVEIAFGHHRVEAARQIVARGLDRFDRLGIVVAPRTNADMLRMMIDENREAFQNDARISMASVGAVIEAFGRDEIELEAPAARGQGVPVRTLPGGKVYNLATVARFMGWTKPSNGQAEKEAQSLIVEQHLLKLLEISRQDEIANLQRALALDSPEATEDQ